MGVCQAYPPQAGFLAGMLDFIDCEARTFGEQGYLALAAPGSTVSVALTGLLTLFVALFGYRMLLGQVPGVRDGVLAFIKIGIVLALTASWPAYRALVYDVVLQGPTQLIAEVGGRSDLPGAGGGLTTRLDTVDQVLDVLAAAGTGNTVRAVQPFPGQVVQPTGDSQVFTGFDGTALGLARTAFLTGTIGAFAIVRLTAGLLLAIAPLFIAFLLFEGTRGLFEGWLRVLAGAAVGAVAVSFALGVELIVLEPWLSDLLARRYANESIAGFPVPLLAVTLVFNVLLTAAILLAVRIALGFRLPIAWPDLSRLNAHSSRSERSEHHSSRHALPIEARSRAAAVVDAISETQRRESRAPALAVAAAAGAPGRTEIVRQGSSTPAGTPQTPLGQSHRRTTQRVSSSAGFRDRAR